MLLGEIFLLLPASELELKLLSHLLHLRYFAGAMSKEALVKFFVDVAESSPIPVMLVLSLVFELFSN